MSCSAASPARDQAAVINAARAPRRIMRDTVLGALCAVILMLGLPAVVMAGDPSTPSATRHRLERPETGDGRRGLISVPRWALLSAGACVVVLGLAGLVRMRREDSTP